MLITNDVIKLTDKYSQDRIKELEAMKRSFVDCHGRYISDYGSMISEGIDEEIQILKSALSRSSV